MPGLTGLEIAEAIRARRRLRFLCKPVSFAQFKAALAAVALRDWRSRAIARRSTRGVLDIREVVVMGASPARLLGLAAAPRVARAH